MLAGLEAADRAGLQVKINTVALKGFNDGEAVSLIEWAHGRGYDLTFIEVMPLGAVEKERSDQYLPLTELRAALQDRFTLAPSLASPAAPRAISTCRRPAAGSASLRR